jgi:hypothetical protein
MTQNLLGAAKHAKSWCENWPDRLVERYGTADQAPTDRYNSKNWMQQWIKNPPETSNILI